MSSVVTRACISSSFPPVSRPYWSALSVTTLSGARFERVAYCDRRLALPGGAQLGHHGCDLVHVDRIETRAAPPRVGGGSPRSSAPGRDVVGGARPAAAPDRADVHG